MPEVPELEHVAAVLTRRLAGRSIETVEITRPVLIRMPSDDFTAALTGVGLGAVRRLGKPLFLDLDTDQTLVVAPMLTGRFQFAADTKRAPARTCFRFNLDNGEGLRYVDQRLLGKVYLVAADALDQVSGFSEMGPDVLAAELSEEAFLERLRKYRVQVKNVIVNAKFMGGVGNAYSDEILFVAGIHPFTRVADLEETRRKRLYAAIRDVMDWAGPIAAEAMGDRVDKKPRDFLRVHRKGGEPCPTCGASISEVSPNRRVTSFCRTCQPA